MKFGDLLTYLDTNTPYEILDGSAAESVAKAKDGSHKNAYAAELINTVLDNAGISDDADSELARIQFVNSLGKMRLKYMADDAPVDGFRLVETVITTADAGFNEEALALKRNN